MVQQINDAVSSVLGSNYGAFASRNEGGSGRRIKLRSPFKENSSIVIPSNTVYEIDLKFTPGEYYGDLPSANRSYVDDETFILVQETTTPNTGTASGRFMPILKENSLLKWVPDFDKRICWRAGQHCRQLSAHPLLGHHGRRRCDSDLLYCSERDANSLFGEIL